MEKTLQLICLIVIGLVYSVSSQQSCWKSTYGRGVGRIPSQCDDGEEKNGLLCYPKCQAGYKGVAFVCWQDCPSGFADHGAFCLKPSPYGRGAGYPWKFGDGFNDRGMFERCHRDQGNGNCEKHGLIVYPKCKPGFHNVGCCICSPNCVNGQTDIGISCAKKTYTRETRGASCTSSQEKQAGLCYTHCNAAEGFYGVGPVCWKGCSGTRPYDCGASCAVSKDACFKGIFDQIVAVGKSVAKIVQLIIAEGDSAEPKEGAAATNAIQAMVEKLKGVSKEQVKDAFEKMAKETGKKIDMNVVGKLSEAMEKSAKTGEKLDFDFGTFLPAGLGDVADAFNLGKC